MAATSTTTKSSDKDDKTKNEAGADQPTSFLDVYSQARDFTEKLDLLAFAVNELGDSKLTKASKEFRDNQLKVEPAEGEVEGGTAEAMEMHRAPGAEDAPGESGDAIEDQVGRQYRAQPGGANA